MSYRNELDFYALNLDVLEDYGSTSWSTFPEVSWRVRVSSLIWFVFSAVY